MGCSITLAFYALAYFVRKPGKVFFEIVTRLSVQHVRISEVRGHECPEVGPHQDHDAQADGKVIKTFSTRQNDKLECLYRSQCYKTLIYCLSTVTPSFCVIKQYYDGNYHGMAVSNTMVIYHGISTLEIISIFITLAVNYHGI
jgi:hypothetical protein